MKIVSAEAMRLAERMAMDRYGIPGRLLMESAGRCCCDAIIEEFGAGNGRKALIVAGKGNNGGDGYVIARFLRRCGWAVKVLVVAGKEEISGDALVNLELLDQKDVLFCPAVSDIDDHAFSFDSADIIVDALFGIGLSKEVLNPQKHVIELVNRSGKPVVSVDIPSGIDGSTGRVLGAGVMARTTVTFGFAKLGHVLYPGREHTGRLVVVDIGLPDQVATWTEGCEFLDCAAARLILRRRDRSGHKGDFGHCLIVAGSTGKTGAAALAANSAVRAGAGLVTLAVPATLNPILELKTTEAMTFPLDDAGMGFLGERNGETIIQALQRKSVLALGPGIGREEDTFSLVKRLVRECDLPMVIDADGLNAIAEDKSILGEKRSSIMVLTPHPGEMSRLANLSIKEIETDRIAAAREFAARYGVFVVLKGAGTIIASPRGETAVNGSGNPGMASGGMGDVLTGVIASLLGQGYEPMEACRLGVFIHGLAADLAAEEKGEIGINATDVQERLPLAFRKVADYGVKTGRN